MQLLTTLWQEVTRGAAQVIPIQQGPVGPQIDWSQFLAGIGVISAIVSAALLLTMKLVIEPKLIEAVKIAGTDMKEWAKEHFPSKSEFDIHATKDEAFQSHTEENMKILSMRLRDLEERR